jgi:hypothetical protein
MLRRFLTFVVLLVGAPSPANADSILLPGNGGGFTIIPSVLSISDASVTWDGLGSENLGFVVSAQINNCGEFDVDYSTGDGSGNAGVDYVSRSGTLSFGGCSPGIQTLTITVPLLNPGFAATETFFVFLHSVDPEGIALVADGQGVGTINRTQPAMSTVPEPATLWLLATSFCALGVVRRR